MSSMKAAATAYEKLKACYSSVKDKLPAGFTPKIGLVLGSGLGDYADSIKIEAVLPYNEIDGFPISTVKGHKGRFVFGYIGEAPVVIMQGRVHYYEGYPMTDVVLPIRLIGMMGAKVLLLTNAAGGVNFQFKPGDFMLIRDHISSFIQSPLIGANIDELGTRFPDMSNVYSKVLLNAVREATANLDIPLREGVYLQFTGPQFETPTEIHMSRILGADAVGMSTVCEAIAAHHMGMQVCGISCISNLGCGMSDTPLSHEEVQETADRIAPLFKKLVTEAIIAMEKII